VHILRERPWASIFGPAFLFSELDPVRFRIDLSGQFAVGGSLGRVIPEA